MDLAGAPLHLPCRTRNCSTGALQAGYPLIEISGTTFWRAKETQEFFHRQMYSILWFR